MSTLLDLDKEIFSPPELGCVLYLPGLPGGGNTLHDRSPYGNHGVITGATWRRTDKGLWYLYYDGGDDVTTITDAASIRPATGTIMFWLNVGSTSTNEDILSKTDNVATDRIAIWEEGAKIRIGLLKDGGWKFILAPATQTISANAWTHTAWVFGESEVGTTHYQDGVDITNAITGDASDETGLDYLVASNLELMLSTGGLYKEGGLALFQMYNQALSALEIQNTFNQEKHLFGVW